MKRAIVSAAALWVVCPHCGEAQPNPEDGSHMWSRSQQVHAIEASPTRTCYSCEKRFVLGLQRMVKAE